MKPSIPPPNLRESSRCTSCAFATKSGTRWFYERLCLKHDRIVLGRQVCDDFEQSEPTP